MISFCVSGQGSLALLPEGGRKIHTKDREPEESREGIALEELDLKYLQYALAVVRYGSVTQAARALYLAQPNPTGPSGSWGSPGLSPVPPVPDRV